MSYRILLASSLIVVALGAAQANPPARTPPTPSAQPVVQQPPATTQRGRARVAVRDTAAPVSTNRPNCAEKKGIEKSECERRDTARDDLPAGVTKSQEPKQ